ncbi:hypothetical protein E2C01_033703 [Portunus trituberculatus]|uniref:Uncharacterized protein n=1 Tax=Portunus trituberculatus TaxID=210409 RepID=A0A5B7F4T4_PORTR|nr:hypothetical protein [Portunus trituberculatus]
MHTFLDIANTYSTVFTSKTNLEEVLNLDPFGGRRTPPPDEGKTQERNTRILIEWKHGTHTDGKGATGHNKNTTGVKIT